MFASHLVDWRRETEQGELCRAVIRQYILIYLNPSHVTSILIGRLQRNPAATTNQNGFIMLGLVSENMNYYRCSDTVLQTHDRTVE
ncbi:UNVERIFIED_CONTAM: hypothetical protein FKN15_018419 [Acipenser sinensis]